MSTRIASRRAAALLAAASILALAACTTHDVPRADSATALGAAPADTPMAASAGTSAASGASATPVRGTISAVSDTALTVTTATGSQQIRVVAPLHVYTRAESDLAHVTPNSFVGVTSVAQPDGSERATEIHVFPEDLRGTGEGSRMMEATSGSAVRSKMTNGSVAGSRMTNGSVAGSRMTNGTVGSSSGGTKITVQYKGGTQTIDVPAGVSVTAIAPTQDKLAVGANVVVIAKSDASGKPSTSAVMLTGSGAKK
jgi:hypothetical protein